MNPTEYKRAWTRRSTQARKDGGLCTVCGIEPPAPGRVNGERCLAVKRARSRDNKDEARTKWLQKVMRKYSMTGEDYAKAVMLVEGKCEICGQKPPRLYVDHDHRTGQFRGLLCCSCNLALGQFKDNARNLQAAVVYLQERTHDFETQQFKRTVESTSVQKSTSDD